MRRLRCVRELFFPSSRPPECECVSRWEELSLWVRDDHRRQFPPRDRAGEGADQRRRPWPSRLPACVMLGDSWRAKATTSILKAARTKTCGRG